MRSPVTSGPGKGLKPPPVSSGSSGRMLLLTAVMMSTVIASKAAAAAATVVGRRYGSLSAAATAGRSANSRAISAWSCSFRPSERTTKTTTTTGAGQFFASHPDGKRSGIPPYRARHPSCFGNRHLTAIGASTTDPSATATTDEEKVTAGAAAEDDGNRLSSAGLSMELRTVADHLPVVRSHLKSRRSSKETLDAAERVSSLSSQRVRLIRERDDNLRRRKEASAVVGKLMRQMNQPKKDDADDDDEQDEEGMQKELEEAKAKSTDAADGAAKAEKELEEIQGEMDLLLACIPNLLDDVVPDGNDDADNEVVSEWGDRDALPKLLGWEEDGGGDDPFVFEPLWHDDVASNLGGYVSEAAVRMSGARFSALSGSVARLERALSSFFVDLHATEHGYTEVSVPFVVSRSALEGTSQLPKFQEDLFAVTPESHTCNGEDAFLIPTGEVPVTNLHRGQVLDETDLPLSYVSCTPCFRAEAGSYGRDTRGLIRSHQFHKVELIKITTPESSSEQHELLTAHAEQCLKLLRLPYRKVRLCSGDVGFAARHCYDLEVWLPGAKEYREISSCSNTGDFQARRMGLRYRPSLKQATSDDTDNKNDNKKKNKNNKKKQKPAKPVLCHTINGSGLAVGRTLVAVLENYQKPDGSVVVPEVLRPYMGGKEILLPPSNNAA